MPNSESINENDGTKSINIENITDEDIENEIMKMEKGSSPLLSTNNNSKDLSGVIDSKENLPISKVNSTPISTMNSIQNTPTVSVSNSIPNSLPNSMPNSTISLTTSESDDELESFFDPDIEEVKRLYGLDIPETILYPYVEYDYIHQKGYLQIYCSKWQVAFNSNFLGVKG